MKWLRKVIREIFCSHAWMRDGVSSYFNGEKREIWTSRDEDSEFAGWAER